MTLYSLEICAGAGGQAIGLERAGFLHQGLLEIESLACETLLANRPEWKVILGDIRDFSGNEFVGIDLLAGGVPCPPFSVAGKQLGSEDGRDLFPEALRLARETEPKAVMLENVKGLLSPKFDSYRRALAEEFKSLGYTFSEWRLLNSSDFGVPQLRPRAVFVAMHSKYGSRFKWPQPNPAMSKTVGETIGPLMGSCGWKGTPEWIRGANNIAPTLVGGSKLHGGPDLGPTRAREAWLRLGVDGRGIANEPPSEDFEGIPRLTVPMTALIQGFPEEWRIVGKKTQAYRQVGNAFPPPVAEAVGHQIKMAIEEAEVDDYWEAKRLEVTIAGSLSRQRGSRPVVV